MAIWIDPAMTAFNSCDPEITDGNSAAEHEDREEEKLGNAIG
jgi:hypothetical protein